MGPDANTWESLVEFESTYVNPRLKSFKKEKSFNFQNVWNWKIWRVSALENVILFCFFKFSTCIYEFPLVCIYII